MGMRDCKRDSKLRGHSGTPVNPSHFCRTLFKMVQLNFRPLILLFMSISHKPIGTLHETQDHYPETTPEPNFICKLHFYDTSCASIKAKEKILHVPSPSSIRKLGNTLHVAAEIYSNEIIEIKKKEYMKNSKARGK